MIIKVKTTRRKIISIALAGMLTIGTSNSFAALGDDVLKKGMQNNDIKVLQQHLKDLGYFENEDTTTYYGDITKNAVMNFQQAKGLDEDGIFGGTSASGFDCSGYTSFVYAQNGVSIPRTSEAQAQAGTKIDKSNLQIGDLLIFSNT